MTKTFISAASEQDIRRIFWRKWQEQGRKNCQNPEQQQRQQQQQQQHQQEQQQQQQLQQQHPQLKMVRCRVFSPQLCFAGTWLDWKICFYIGDINPWPHLRSRWLVIQRSWVWFSLGFGLFSSFLSFIPFVEFPEIRSHRLVQINLCRDQVSLKIHTLP